MLHLSRCCSACWRQHKALDSHNRIVRRRTLHQAMLVSIRALLIFCFSNRIVSVFWTYQTNGKCSDHCNDAGTYAFAVIQYTNCWCSNYIPSTTTDISSCQKDCPGFPSEKCGDQDKGLYIYIKLAGQPSGTAGGSSQPSSTEVSSATPAPSSTVLSSSDAITVSTSMFHCIATV